MIVCLFSCPDMYYTSLLQDSCLFCKLFLCGLHSRWLLQTVSNMMLKNQVQNTQL